jgi:hypothetical protein
MKKSKANFADTNLPAHAILRSLALCTALAVACPSMAQPPAANSGQAISPFAASGDSGQSASPFATSGASGQALPTVEVYKSPQCGCCKTWAEHLQKNGFTVMLHEVNDVPAARKKLGMPNKFGSCHTAKVGQYLVEGHVPAADIKKLLKNKPKAIGLAVPAMPPGSPGMESDHPVPYDTLLIGMNGNAKVFARH